MRTRARLTRKSRGRILRGRCSPASRLARSVVSVRGPSGADRSVRSPPAGGTPLRHSSQSPESPDPARWKMSEKYDAIVAREKQVFMPGVRRWPLALERGQGSRVWDVEGREFI